MLCTVLAARMVELGSQDGFDAFIVAAEADPDCVSAQ